MSTELLIPESSQRTVELDDILWELVSPGSYLPISQCEVGGVYWVESRSVGSVALCLSVESDGRFTGLHSKCGRDYLFEERHWDGDNRGTVKPLLKIDSMPLEIATDELSIMNWLLDINIGFHDELTAYLQALPEKFHTTPSFEWLSEMEQQIVRILQLKKRLGFNLRDGVA